MSTLDEELVRLCQAGRLEAFNLLMSRWEAKVLNFAYHFLGDAEAAHDVCQDAFLRALRHVGKYEPKPTFAAWLFGIARNLCIDADRRRRVRGPTAEPVDEADPAPSPAERAARNEHAELVGQALHSLPEEQRTPIIMRHYLDMPFPEIAQTLGCPATTVKSRAYAGLCALKQHLRRLGIMDRSESS